MSSGSTWKKIPRAQGAVGRGGNIPAWWEMGIRGGPLVGHPAASFTHIVRMPNSECRVVPTTVQAATNISRTIRMLLRDQLSTPWLCTNSTLEPKGHPGVVTVLAEGEDPRALGIRGQCGPGASVPSTRSLPEGGPRGCSGPSQILHSPHLGKCGGNGPEAKGTAFEVPRFQGTE